MGTKITIADDGERVEELDDQEFAALRESQRGTTTTTEVAESIYADLLTPIEAPRSPADPRPLTVNEWMTLLTLVDEEMIRLLDKHADYTARQMRDLAADVRDHLDAALRKAKS